METNIKEYCEEYPVKIERYIDNDRLVVKAYNEGKQNFTCVDLIDLLEYVKNKMPDVWNSI